MGAVSAQTKRKYDLAADLWFRAECLDTVDGHTGFEMKREIGV